MSLHNSLTKSLHKKGPQLVNDFAIEQLEARLEMLWVPVPYIGICYKKVWFVWVPYPCWKIRWIWI
jgi:hypothetical protein